MPDLRQSLTIMPRRPQAHNRGMPITSIKSASPPFLRRRYSYMFRWRDGRVYVAPRRRRNKMGAELPSRAAIAAEECSPWRKPWVKVGNKRAPKSLRENCFGNNPVERALRKSSPEGTNEISPALQCWGKWEKGFKSRRDDRVLPQTRRGQKIGCDTDLDSPSSLRRA
jgi:hypothetical protein